MKLLDEVLAELENNHATVPQPFGHQVAEAYRDGRIGNFDEALHVIACLLGRCSKEQS